MNSGSALLWALRVARQHGGAAAALAAAGISMPQAERLEGVQADIEDLLGRSATDPAIRGALALVILAGGVAHNGHRKRRLQDPTSFVIDQELVVKAAYGQSILRPSAFDRSATLLEQRAERSRLASRNDVELIERQRARKARDGAKRARANALHLRSRDTAAPAGPPSVTSRQTDILGLASHGLTSAEIGEQLGVSVSTVKTHFDNIYMGLGVSDKAAAVAAALRHGLIE